MRYSYAVGKQHCVIIAAEGAHLDPFAIASFLSQNSPTKGFREVEVRVTILGHIQRGGAPTAADRLLASRLGSAAVDYLCDGYAGHMAGLHGNQVVRVPLEEVETEHCGIDLSLERLAEILSR